MDILLNMVYRINSMLLALAGEGGLDKFVDGMMSVSGALQKIGGAGIVIAIGVAGLGAIKDGGDGKRTLKENIIWIIVGGGLVFTAGSIGKLIAGWFM